MFRKVVPGTASRLTTVDHVETFGRHILDSVTRDLGIGVCVDLGCGGGADLTTVMKNQPQARCIGVDLGEWNRLQLEARGIELISVNIEKEPLPFDDETIDFIIANQVLEHTKEIFFINHEIFRTLKVGGFLYLGVPNVLSLHNRLLGLAGVHPTCAKMISGHVRVFSKRDLKEFYHQVAGSVVSMERFYGSQFYPFPRIPARFLATTLPALAVSIFVLIKKKGSYDGQFLDWLQTVGPAGLATDYYNPRAELLNG